MASFLNKKYKLVSSDKFDEYMQELKIGFVMRKLGNSATPVVELTCEGDVYTFTTTTMLKTTTIKFKLGEEFEEERGDGAKVKSIITLDGNKMTHVMKGEPESTITREFNGDELKAVLTVNDVVCTRIYKAE
ncbi:sodium/calcium exchanger regulatory protein 1 [Daphnia magna]|uniref:Uncharacterized protein n=2 Tax=Daphnia magna TaxID=35525 RepID=A0ABQ9YVV2_9CRUS|nr:sodium/calcium exchanger regulatory protein 1 [Daphnia magna]KAK4004721.1 hypothetical protein OUZ56_006447 [Daphnia magna]KZS21865.1 Myelin P2 protein [Daphnia magna]